MSIATHLGQKSEYKNNYDAGLLVREARSLNRTKLINLDFVGFDTWNAYESSFLLDNGLPVTGCIKISYPSDNDYIVESKSLKLYLNSFNGTKLGAVKKLAQLEFEHRVGADLCKLLETRVKVNFIPRDVMAGAGHSEFDFYKNSTFQTLEDTIDEKTLAAVTGFQYTESAEVLGSMAQLVDVTEHFHSALLRSRCKITFQPDQGDVYIYITSKNVIDTVSLLKYIVSFREECHFHEEIIETMYNALWKAFQPSELFVMGLYARRGGIDINPVRASNVGLLYGLCKNLANTRTPHIKTAKQ